MLYKVYEAKISDNPNIKGITTGDKLDEFESDKKYAPTMIIQVKNENRRIRTVDYKNSQLAILMVE